MAACCMLHAWGKGTIKMPCPPRNTALQQDEVVSQEEMFECQDESFTVNHQKKKYLELMSNGNGHSYSSVLSWLSHHITVSR